MKFQQAALHAFFILQLLSQLHDLANASSPFPRDFLFGVASSAYQVEGAYLSDGKGLNNWDVFSHITGAILDGSNGDIADDNYHRYLEDIELMHSVGVNSYRFSISWARILPYGRFGEVNLAGINHYNNLIDALLQNEIQPFVTLSHYDIPQELEVRYGAWLSPQIQEDFQYYADVCFEAFGDRVKYWATLNEPNAVVLNSYQLGIYPPCRCSGLYGNCASGNSETEPFIAAHNFILSHATAVDTYRTKYQNSSLGEKECCMKFNRAKESLTYIMKSNALGELPAFVKFQKEQGGTIGIVINAAWFEPISNSSVDILAAKRAHSFIVNWFLDPIVFGRYPGEMEEILGTTLPAFSETDLKRLQNGLDFIGINHYTSLYVKDCMYSTCNVSKAGGSKAQGYFLPSDNKDGVLIGEPTDMEWYYVCPQAMEKMVLYLKERYNNKPLFIVENGYGEENHPNATIEDFLHDSKRVNYLSSYLDALASAIRKGADVRGYFVWALLDNFEWKFGYTKRFGIYHVDYKTLKRTPKLSATWYKQFIAKHTRSITVVPDVKQEHSQYY